MIPVESEHFAFYVPGSESEILPLEVTILPNLLSFDSLVLTKTHQDSPIYTEDRIGLRALDQEGRLVYCESLTQNLFKK